MKIDELKTNITTNATKLISEWFDSNSIIDNISKGVANALLHANINKFDKLINLFADENGDLNIDMLIENIISQFPEKMEIDIQRLTNMPFPKILLLTRQDIVNLLK